MKNKEKFAENIKKISSQCDIKEYCVSENCTGKNINLNCVGCVERFLKWLDEEAIPEKKHFSSDELAIMKSISTNYNFIARDKNDDLFLYTLMPVKMKYLWELNFDCEGNKKGTYSGVCMFGHLFRSIRWEDAEPVRIDDYVERQK